MFNALVFSTDKLIGLLSETFRAINTKTIIVASVTATFVIGIMALGTVVRYLNTVLPHDTPHSGILSENFVTPRQ